ncbi:MAG: glycosyltransferase family 2 protein [Nodosilinea sp.]
MYGTEAPFVSVIIPVFNDGERLRLCLTALAEQTYERSRFEIIVVDNGSDHLELIQALVADYDNATLALEPTPGSYAARNRGLALAQGEAIAFTDADCIPAPDWLAVGVQLLTQTPNCGLVAGQIQLFFQNPDRPTLVELYESVRALPQREFVEVHHYGATANVFALRQVIDAVGGFDPHLKSSGDAEWGQRVYAQGYRQVYGNAAIVHHPARSSLAELYQRTRRLAGGHYDVQMKEATSPRQRQMVFWRLLLHNLTPPIFFMINTFKNLQLQGIGQKLKVTWAMVLVRYISVWELLRLRLGGKSSRA